MIKYTEDHEWVRMDSDTDATVGITDFAQEQLGELVYVELPNIAASISQGDDCAVVESVKAAGDVKAPVSGTIVSCNESLDDTPELINENAMGEGWLFTINLDDPTELEGLMDESDYQAYLTSLE
jgi:glycine cleavage system H protein